MKKLKIYYDLDILSLSRYGGIRRYFNELTTNKAYSKEFCLVNPAYLN